MGVSLPVIHDDPFEDASPIRTDLPSSPRDPHVHLFEADRRHYLFVVDGSRLYEIGTGRRQALARALDASDSLGVNELLAIWGLSATPSIDDTPPGSPPIRALSLAVAQKCNLGCTYCYAQEGAFGGPAKNMPLETALTAVERLFEEAGPGDRVNLAFLGGEPLYNRPVLRAAVERAVGLSEERGVRVGFSITTNGTLLTSEDGDFFERHGFAVTISLDGVGEIHDRLRPFKSGKGTYERVIRNAAPLLARQCRMQVSARVTVTPRNLCLPETLEDLIQLGFHSVGFSPMLSSPTGRDQMRRAELEAMLEQMIQCGAAFERQIVRGRRYPFLNMVNAMREIHRGTHRPYPCGAGAGYLGVSAEGDLFACHRFVDDPAGAMGSMADGVDRTRQAAWLSGRHVHRQEPCRSCWARYMCGGGCHHEVIRRGRPACDYIRGWLHYCLQAYTRLSQASPDYFGLPGPGPSHPDPSPI
jgi:uncharacterized protein